MKANGLPGNFPISRIGKAFGTPARDHRDPNMEFPTRVRREGYEQISARFRLLSRPQGIVDDLGNVDQDLSRAAILPAF